MDHWSYFAYGYQTFQHHLLSNFLLLNRHCTFVKIIWPCICESISELYSVSLSHITIFIPISECLDYYILEYLLKYKSSNFVLILEIVLATLGPLHFHMHVRIILSISTEKKKPLEILIDSVLLNPQISLGKLGTLKILNLPIHKIGVYLSKRIWIFEMLFGVCKLQYPVLQ